MEKIAKATTALVVTDPQNDFLSETGRAWSLVKESVREHDTIEHLEMLFQAAKAAGLKVFISPHFYYPHDQDWQTAGPMEKLMHKLHMFEREHPISHEGFAGSGADWLPAYLPYIEDGETIICAPHKIYGPEPTDLALELRKHGINRVVLAGMAANLCVEAHLRELIEQGFAVTVVKDATAASNVPQLGDGYAAAVTNFNYIANETVTTEEAVKGMRNAN